MKWIFRKNPNIKIPPFDLPNLQCLTEYWTDKDEEVLFLSLLEYRLLNTQVEKDESILQPCFSYLTLSLLPFLFPSPPPHHSLSSFFFIFFLFLFKGAIGFMFLLYIKMVFVLTVIHLHSRVTLENIWKQFDLILPAWRRWF